MNNYTDRFQRDTEHESPSSSPLTQEGEDKLFYSKRLDTQREVVAFLNSNMDIELVNICISATNYSSFFIVFYKSKTEKL